MMRGAPLVAALLATVFVSSLAKVWVVHVNRTTFTAVQSAQAIRDEMNIEWGRLQIEQAAWSTHARVEQVAAERLSMRVPDPGTVVIVKP
ncbi:MAG: cell division protein FtsL [Gammaproteobacteria bacterium]